MESHNLRKRKVGKAFLLSSIAVLTSSVLAGCSSESLAKVEVGVYPNSAASNAKISEEFASLASDLTESAFSYFKEIALIPRQSGHLEEISAYIKKFAIDHGYPISEDEAGNFAFDVPASGDEYKDYKKIILQAHLDMVVASSPDISFDPVKDHIVLCEDEESFHSDGTTNIGADDGEGLATLLSIASSSSCAHGPLRFLFTADEDIGLVGASKMDASLLDSDYLINVDGSNVGQIIYAAAGALLGEFKAEAEMEPLPSGYSFVDVEVKGLKGGHSSLHASSKLLGATTVMKSVLKEVDSSVTSWRLSSLNGGEFTNAIPNSASLLLAVPSEKKSSAISSIDSAWSTLKKEYPEETGAAFSCLEVASSADVFSSEQSKKIYALLDALPDGMVDSQEDSQTSSNVSPVKIGEGKIELSSLYRSLKNSNLSQMKTDFSSFASQNGFSFEIGTDFPAWEQDKDDPFINLFYDGLKSACHLEGVKSKCAGGLETSLFAQKKPGMKMLSIGADVVGEHVLGEKLYKKSFPAHMAAILSVLKNNH